MARVAGAILPSPLKGERIRRLASLLASRSWRGVVWVARAASTPRQASLAPRRGASFAILSPFRGEGCLVVQPCNVGFGLLASGNVVARFFHPIAPRSAEGHTVRIRAVEQCGRGTAEIGTVAAHLAQLARRKSRSFNRRSAVHERSRSPLSGLRPARRTSAAPAALSRARFRRRAWRRGTSTGRTGSAG